MAQPKGSPQKAPWSGLKIVLAVTGGIAAYKAVEVARQLTADGAEVWGVMTPEAGRFLAPLTLQTLTYHPVVSDLFALEASQMSHVAFGESADAYLVVPATANLLAKAALGLADDAVSAALLAAGAPICYAPAMNWRMWANPATQANIATLRQRGAVVVEPEEGRLASGHFGQGRLAPTSAILEGLARALGQGRKRPPATGKGVPRAAAEPLLGASVVVTAGGTREPLDPVRFLTNASSGRMGRALAEAAAGRGARVKLITAAKDQAEVQAGGGAVEVEHVDTAVQMLEALRRALRGADVLIMAAAVADFRVAAPQKRKQPKGSGPLTLKLEPNPDLLLATRRRKGAHLPVRIGFAAETHDLIDHARAKLAAKDLDLIVANSVTQEEGGPGSDYNQVTLLAPNSEPEELPRLPKVTLAELILDRAAELLARARRGKAPT